MASPPAKWDGFAFGEVGDYADLLADALPVESGCHPRGYRRLSWLRQLCSCTRPRRDEITEPLTNDREALA